MSDSSADEASQELGSMYDYLAKVILLGPSGTGKFVALKPLPVAGRPG